MRQGERRALLAGERGDERGTASHILVEGAPEERLPSGGVGGREVKGGAAAVAAGANRANRSAHAAPSCQTASARAPWGISALSPRTGGGGARGGWREAAEKISRHSPEAFAPRCDPVQCVGRRPPGGWGTTPEGAPRRLRAAGPGGALGVRRGGARVVIADPACLQGSRIGTLSPIRTQTAPLSGCVGHAWPPVATRKERRGGMYRHLGAHAVHF